MIDRVVIAWDGSRRASQAADWAARRQDGSGTLAMVRVLDEATVAPDWERSGGTVAGAREVLDEEIRRLTTAYPQLQVSGTVVFGRREDELERFAEPGTLLVLGTQERVGSRLRFRFSLAVRLAARARGPVAVVPEGATAPADGPVVAGVDGSATSIAAALLAAEEATRRGVKLIVVHAWWEAAEWEVGALPLDAEVITTFESEHRRVLEACLQPIRARFPGLAVEPRLVHSPRADALIAAAEGASALVVGKHSRTVARALLLGSVSRNILLDVWTPTIVAGLPVEEELRLPGDPAAGYAAA